MAPIDVVQAQAEQATRRQGLVTAENTKRTAELTLKRLIVSGTEDPNWRAVLDPVDRPDFQTEQAFGASLVATVISASAFLAAGWVEKKVRERYT